MKRIEAAEAEAKAMSRMIDPKSQEVLIQGASNLVP